jgi:hypothetical protein
VAGGGGVETDADDVGEAAADVAAVSGLSAGSSPGGGTA